MLLLRSNRVLTGVDDHSPRPAPATGDAPSSDRRRIARSASSARTVGPERWSARLGWETSRPARRTRRTASIARRRRTMTARPRLPAPGAESPSLDCASRAGSGIGALIESVARRPRRGHRRAAGSVRWRRRARGLARRPHRASEPPRRRPGAVRESAPRTRGGPGRCPPSRPPAGCGATATRGLGRGRAFVGPTCGVNVRHESAPQR
jgi:hypothetical protein